MAKCNQLTLLPLKGLIDYFNVLKHAKIVVRACIGVQYKITACLFPSEDADDAWKDAGRLVVQVLQVAL